MYRKNFAATVVAVLIGTAMLAVLAPIASAAPSSAARFCNHNLDTGVAECFDSRTTQLANKPSTASVWVLTVYNWIDYNPGGGVADFYRAAQCTAPTSDIDYPSSASDTTGRNLQVWSYANGITMNNTFSSVLTPTGGCDIKLWDYNNYGSGGGSSEWILSCSHLGQPSRPGCPSANWYDRAGSFKLS